MKQYLLLTIAIVWPLLVSAHGGHLVKRSQGRMSIAIPPRNRSPPRTPSPISSFTSTSSSDSDTNSNQPRQRRGGARIKTKARGPAILFANQGTPQEDSSIILPGASRRGKFRGEAAQLAVMTQEGGSARVRAKGKNIDLISAPTPGAQSTTHMKINGQTETFEAAHGNYLQKTVTNPTGGNVEAEMKMKGTVLSDFKANSRPQIAGPQP